MILKVNKKIIQKENTNLKRPKKLNPKHTEVVLRCGKPRIRCYKFHHRSQFQIKLVVVLLFVLGANPNNEIDRVLVVRGVEGPLFNSGLEHGGVHGKRQRHDDAHGRVGKVRERQFF